MFFFNLSPVLSLLFCAYYFELTILSSFSELKLVPEPTVLARAHAASFLISQGTASCVFFYFQNLHNTEKQYTHGKWLKF